MEDEKFSQTHIAAILKQLEEGTDANELCKEHKISLTTLYRWKALHGGTESLLSRLYELEEENYKLKGKLADINIQKEAKNTGDTDHIYRILAANIPGTAITILDRDERYLLAEGDFLATMGYIKETMPGKKISEVITPENYSGYYQQTIQRAFAGETILVERQTLSSYYTLMKVVPLKDGKGEIFAIMFVLIDVTPIKQAQFELTKINKDLESKVLERTQQLQEANRQLESFSYSVSHDLRAPLRSISGFAAILKEDYSSIVKDEEFDKVADRVIGNASRMEKLINDLLDFSRLERKDLSKSLIEMDKLVHEIMNDLSAEESSRKLDIRISALEPVMGDAGLMRQVWINLLSNALKYTRKKELARIDISCVLDQDTVRYSVSDNGAGFDMKFAGKLFGVFQRLHKEEDFEGTGVGLALVKSIIQRHGGKICAESEVGKGTTFYFTLPLTAPVL
jgi:PAS domain S-box-containing protein